MGIFSHLFKRKKRKSKSSAQSVGGVRVHDEEVTTQTLLHVADEMQSDSHCSVGGSSWFDSNTSSSFGSSFSDSSSSSSSFSDSSSSFD